MSHSDTPEPPGPELTSGPNDLWSLLREHAAWPNHEKQIIWRRFSASLTAVSIYFAGSMLAYDRVSPAVAFGLNILGLGICTVWLRQTLSGWSLLDRRLRIVREIQGLLKTGNLAKWPLAFIPKEPGGPRRDWIKIQALLITIGFILAFLVLAGASGHTALQEAVCSHATG